MKRCTRLLGAAILVAQFCLFATSGNVNAESLPQWVERVWDDFPVEIRVDSRETLDALFSRDDLRITREDVAIDRSIPGEERFLVRTRVTDRVQESLVSGGYRPERVRDDVRIGFENAVESWKNRIVADAGADATDDIPRTGDRAVYHSVAEIEQLLLDAEADHPAIAKTFSIGSSVQGRDLIGLHISDNVLGAEEAEPEIRISSTMHGDEPPGMEMMLYLIEHLTNNYPADPVVQNLVDNYDIWILPLHNPDGYVSGQRYNSHGVDLNRNFPVPDGSIGDDNTWSQEPETSQYIATLGRVENFVISLNYHSGALVANYPWDYTSASPPDEDAIYELCLEYTTYNNPMYTGSWYQGITNGWDWYSIDGGLQDWSYEATGCIDVTLEMSNNKWPSASQLPGFWDDNRESLLHWIKAARYGINGVVTDAATGLPVEATITIAGNSESVYTDPDVGDYYKLLDTGTYSLTVTAAEYEPQTIPGINVTWGTPTVRDIELLPMTVSAPEAIAQATPSLEILPIPSRSSTTLRFTLPQEIAEIDLAVFDSRGRRVRQLLAGPILDEGGSVQWDGCDDRGRAVPAGVYFGRLGIDGRAAVSERIVITR